MRCHFGPFSAFSAFISLCVLAWLILLSNPPITDGESPVESSLVESDKKLLLPSHASGGSCHHRYAAQPGVPFPCTPRVTRYNNLVDFFQWTAAEERRKRKLLLPVRAFCAKRLIDAFPSVNERMTRLRQTDRLAFIGCGSSRPDADRRKLLWDYADGVSVPEDVFLSKGGSVFLSTRLVTADEERAAGVGWSGQWHRCWVIPMMRTLPSGNKSNAGVIYEPTCQAGDLVDVRMQSRTAKVAVDRVIDMDDGVLEVQFYIRKRGAYSFCADLLVTHQDMLRALAAQGFPGDFTVKPFGRLSPSALVGRYATLRHAMEGPVMTPLNRTPAYPANVFCVSSSNFLSRHHHNHSQRHDSQNSTSQALKPWEEWSLQFNDGVDVVPLPVRCDVMDDFDRFRFGAWYFVGDRCDAVHCVDLRPSAGTAHHPLLQAMEGWLWASDVCQMRLFTDDELLLSLFPGAWLFAWGPSTLREPATDMLEVHLHTKVFHTFMRDLWRVPPENQPGFFAYRRWDRCVAPDTSWSQKLFNRTGRKHPSTRITFVWGGCLSISNHNCLKKQGVVLFQERLNFSIGAAARKRLGEKFSKCGSQGFPTVLLLDHVVWRGILANDHPSFLARMRYLLMEQLPQLYKEVVSASPGDAAVAHWPLTVWHTGPAINNADMGLRDANYYRPREMHLQWVMEDELSVHYRLPDDDGRVIHGVVESENADSVVYIQNNNRYPPLTAKRVFQLGAQSNVTRTAAFAPPIVLISRHQITLPLRFGNEFCRNGVHYGSTFAHCLTAYRAGTEEHFRCVRKIWADKMLQLTWWNAMSRESQQRAHM